MNTSTIPIHARHNAQLGFSMIEVLVSLLLMTIGLLGIGGLMASGVSNSTGFDLSSRSTQSANEIMDAMRANSINAASYITSYGTDTTTLTSTAPAVADRLQWLTAIRRLPGGDGKIEYADATSACAVAASSECEFKVTVRFANCVGSLSATQLSACNNAVSDAEKREISFRFRI